MGADAGFDMVPRLSRGAEDVKKWKDFLNNVLITYKNDAQVKIQHGYIEFEAGEHPKIPFEGHKFLRFSSKVTGAIAGRTGVWDYITSVSLMAKLVFGSRVRSWSELGFYDWRDVHESNASYSKVGGKITVSHFTGDGNTSGSAEYPLRSMNNNLFEVLDIPGKGRGLVARCNIRSGTRILCEKPLLIVPAIADPLLQMVIFSQLKSLSEEQQRLFLSMHNNSPGQNAFAGITRTNALACGPGAATKAAIYPTICLINHSCLPNCHHNWNEDVEHETIHAIRTILAGEEITISYNMSHPTRARREYLRSKFGFDCHCELCSLSPEGVRASDDRRKQIESLDEMIGNPLTISMQPLVGLHACRTQLGLVIEEFRSQDMAYVHRLYYDAFQTVIAHGDQARAKVFAERAYTTYSSVKGRIPRTRKEPRS